MERRLAAILAADVVGYTRLMGEDEAGTLAALKAHREEFIEPKIADHRGRVVKLMGDGALARLPNGENTLHCMDVPQTPFPRLPALRLCRLVGILDY